MKRVLRLTVGVLVGLLLLVGAIFLARRLVEDHERLYEGRTLVYWREQLTNRQAHASPPVIDALAEFGSQSTQAVPSLIKLLDDHSSKDIMEAVRSTLKKIDPEAATNAGVR